MTASVLADAIGWTLIVAYVVGVGHVCWKMDRLAREMRGERKRRR